MNPSSSRLTLFALISAIEEDLRTEILSSLEPLSPPADLLGSDLNQKTLERLKKDGESFPDQPTLFDLVFYLDFADAYQLLNSHRAHLPSPISSLLAKCTPGLDRIVPIRNRVYHSRPLHFDDLVIVVDLARTFIKRNSGFWSVLSHTVDRLDADPSFVLGLQIPSHEYDQEHIQHNLPTPEFDDTGFIGRDDLIEHLFSLISGPYPVITIVGEGGIGKTALAQRVAYDILDQIPNPFDAIVWSTSKTARLTQSDVVEIEGSIKTSLGLLSDVQKALTSQRSSNPMDEVLQDLSEFRILLILDNIETVLDDYLREFLSKLPQGSKALITSRIGVGAYEFPVTLPPLPSDDSIRFLRTLLKTRGLSDLARVESKRLVRYTNRMKNNPGYMKWFVSAVQSGTRPEDVLDKPDVFLDYCMSNVYNYLDENSRYVLSVMQSIPGRHNQAELAHLCDRKDIRELQRSLQNLLRTNMVVMKSVPRGSTYESGYELGDMARDYLARHHPVDQKRAREFLNRKKIITGIRDELEGAVKVNPFNIENIRIRSKSDVLIAKQLRDALRLSRAKKTKEATEIVREAKQVAPDYYEVHRIEGFLLALQNDVYGADYAYQAAIQLETDYAPLRLWYGQFLMRYMEDLDRAREQLEIGLSIRTDSSELLREVGRIYLMQKEFGKAEEIVTKLKEMDSVYDWEKRRILDLDLQLRSRSAESECENHNWHGGLTSIEQLMRGYKDIEESLRDDSMKKTLGKSLRTVRNCFRGLTNVDEQTRALVVGQWILNVIGKVGRVASKDSGGVGTIETKDKLRLRFDLGSWFDRRDADVVSVGDNVVCSVGRRQGSEEEFAFNIMKAG